MPVQQVQIPGPGRVIDQNVYILVSVGIGLSFEQRQGDTVYVIFVIASDQEALNAPVFNTDIGTFITHFTIRPDVDISDMQPVNLDADWLRIFETNIRSMMTDFNIPGAAVAIVQDGNIIYSDGFGVRDIYSNAPVNADTRFMIGSITKSMTTIMLSTLVEDGTLDWDHPAVAYMPEFALSDPDATAQIRLRDLVNNSSGVPRHDIRMSLDYMTPSELLDDLASLPLAAEPGEAFNYSNYMFTVAGYLAARVVGATDDADLQRTYNDLMQARIFDPTGMANTTLDFEMAVSSDNHALPHMFNVDIRAFLPGPLDIERAVNSVGPAGMVWSSADDMAGYVSLLLNGGTTADGAQIIQQESLEALWEPVVPVAGPMSYYAMGWIDDSFKGARMIHHDGGTVGFSSQLALLPDHGLGVVVLSNRGLGSNFTTAVVEYVFEGAFELEHSSTDQLLELENAVNSLFEGMLNQPTIETDPDTVADLIGEYDYDITVEMGADGRLTLNAESIDIPLLQLDQEATQFATAGDLAGYSVSFTRDESIITMTITSVLSEDSLALTKQSD